MRILVRNDNETLGLALVAPERRQEVRRALQVAAATGSAAAKREIGMTG